MNELFTIFWISCSHPNVKTALADTNSSHGIKGVILGSKAENRKENPRYLIQPKLCSSYNPVLRWAQSYSSTHICHGLNSGWYETQPWSPREKHPRPFLQDSTWTKNIFSKVQTGKTVKQECLHSIPSLIDVYDLYDVSFQIQ